MDTKHHFSSGVYVRQMFLPKDNYAVTHSHNYDHLSILAYGSAKVICDGVETLYKSGDVATIKAGCKHTVIAVEDSMWFCIHATDETDQEKMDSVLIHD